VTYLDYLNRFNQWLESNALPANAIVLYYRLLHAFNRAGWPRNLRVDTLRLMMMSGCQKDAAYRARERLKEAGFLTYEKGSKGKPTVYFLSEKTTESATVSATESATVSATQKKRYKTKKKKEENIGPEPLRASEPPAASFLLNDKSLFDISQEQAARWQELFPAVDVPQELREITAWCEANPRKRKPRSEAMRFVVSWLAREQDKGAAGTQKPAPSIPKAAKSYDIRELEEMSHFDLPEGL